MTWFDGLRNWIQSAFDVVIDWFNDLFDLILSMPDLFFAIFVQLLLDGAELVASWLPEGQDADASVSVFVMTAQTIAPYLRVINMLIDVPAFLLLISTIFAIEGAVSVLRLWRIARSLFT